MRQMSGKFAFVLAIGFGLAASLLVWVYLKNLANAAEPVETVAVVITASDIPPRTTLTKEMLKIQQVPPDVLHAKAFTSTQQLEGKVNKLALTSGEQVLNTKLFSEREESGLAFIIPPGKRGVSVGVSEVIGSGGLLVPGDRVDVVAVFDSRTAGKDMATLIIQDVEVVAVAQLILGEEPVSFTKSMTQQNGAFGSSSKEQQKTEPNAQPMAKSVTLAVSPDEAQRLILAEEKGKIRLALRPYGDKSRVEVSDTILTVTRGLGQ